MVLRSLISLIETLPPFTHKCLSVAFVIGVAGLSLSIGRGTAIKINQEGIDIKRQAYLNQSTASRTLLLLQIQQTAIEQLEADIEEFSRRYKAGEELAEKVENVSKIIPPLEIEELEEAVRESEEVLISE